MMTMIHVLNIGMLTHVFFSCMMYGCA